MGGVMFSVQNKRSLQEYSIGAEVFLVSTLLFF